MAKTKSIYPGLLSSPESITYSSWDSRVGTIHAATSTQGILRIELGPRPDFPSLVEQSFGIKPHRNDRTLSNLKQEMDLFFLGRTFSFKTSFVFFHGTLFNRKVWHALAKIPYGQTRSYTWIADQIGHPRAYRAVGQACGLNPVPILLPCHRVIATGGGMGGYTGGFRYKKWLLHLEQTHVDPATTGFE